MVVGDSTSDILGGHAAGAITIAVLTGARTSEARSLLAQSNPDFTIEDITKLPELLEHLDSLATIQHLQFQEREKAELLLQRWLARHMNVLAESVTLTPKVVSLNSFNGFYRSDGEEYFFKTHVEEQGISGRILQCRAVIPGRLQHRKTIANHTRRWPADGHLSSCTLACHI